MLGNVSQIVTVSSDLANRYLEIGWVFLCGGYAPPTEKEPGYFTLVLGWPRELGTVKRP